MVRVTYKIELAGHKFSASTRDFINNLTQRKDAIYHGETGVYLGRRVTIKDQELYFPFIDIDPAKNLKDEKEKIESAITHTRLTLGMLEKLNVAQHFMVIATGGEGFRMVSSLLFDRDSYQAFVRLITSEFLQIIDTQPLKELAMPYQFFAYKGHPKQNKKTLIDRHSVIIEQQKIRDFNFGSREYIELTRGKPDPASVIESVKQFFSFELITDLNALGPFGQKLGEYKKLIDDIQINPFEYIKYSKKSDQISLEVMSQMLNQKGIPHKISQKGKKRAISFDGMPCPACGKKTANSGAFPPAYTLYCFNSNCEAHRSKGGLILHKWSGIPRTPLSLPGGAQNEIDNFPLDLTSKKEARKLIIDTLQTTSNTLFLITPGVGKTHSTLQYLCTIAGEKTIIYSCYNRALQEEAHNKAKSFTQDPKNLYLLESREALCQKQKKLELITSSGYSPAEILCPTCEYRDSCQYRNQRKDPKPGIYFSTHHMLQYLEHLISAPDLIILDENIIPGFLMSDFCTENQLRSLSNVLNQIDNNLIKRLLDLAHKIGEQVRADPTYPVLINGRKLSGPETNERSLLELLAEFEKTTEKKLRFKLMRILDTIEKLASSELYKKKVDLKAVHWLKGLLARDVFSSLFISQKGELSFNIKKLTTIHFKGTPIKILDATGNLESAQAIFQRKFEKIDANVGWSAKKVHVKINTSRSYMENANDKDLQNLLETMIKEISGQRVMVISYKKILSQIVSLCVKIDPSKQYFEYHFQGPRGINTYASCDAVLAIGLPYSNLNSAGQDAYILFPQNKEAPIRESWVFDNMEWELIQNIHRIRPVNKECVEIVLASSFWPSFLGKPEKEIDRSKSANWKEIAISQLDPFVKEYGFLNQDIGFLSGVYVKSKENLFSEFNLRLEDIIKGHLFSHRDQTNSEFRPFCLWEKSFLSSGLPLNPSSKEDELKTYLIFVIYNIYYKNLVGNNKYLSKCNFFNFHLLKKKYNRIETVLSNTTQWTELQIYFKEKYHHFESFSLKLPFSRGKAVNGVGHKDNVLKFYDILNRYEIFGHTDLKSYKTKETSKISMDPLPDGFLSIYVPPENSEIFYIGDGKEAFSIAVSDELAIEKYVSKGKKTLVTNDGKKVARKILFANKIDPKSVRIVDILLNEKIISNGEVDFKDITLSFVFKKYGLQEEVDNFMVLSNLYKTWVEQDKTIKVVKLDPVIKLEQKVQWVTSRIESTGMEIDVLGILDYQEKILAQMVTLEGQIHKIVPQTLSLTNTNKLKAFINNHYRLNLGSIDKNAVNFVTHPKAKALLSMVIEYRRLKNSNDDIERYTSLMDAGDYRVRDEIQQINTKTGRFYRPLQTVPKEGPLRTFFRAKKGSKLIICDYSQQEARIIAGLSGDKEFINLYNAKKDVYREVAKIVFNQDEGITPEQRNISKRIVLGLNNGQTEYSIFEDLNKNGLKRSLEEVRAFIDTYMGAFPNIFSWRSKRVQTAKIERQVTTPLGRRMIVLDTTKERSIYNLPVQGTGADGLKLALIYIDQELQNLDARIVHMVHDEIVVESREEISDRVSLIIKEKMEEVFQILIPNVPFLVTPEIRDTWGEGVKLS